MSENIPKMFYTDFHSSKEQEASYLYALVTGKRSVSRRNMASWYLRLLNKIVKCDPIELIERDDTSDVSSNKHTQEPDQTDSRSRQLKNDDDKDIFLVSIVNSTDINPSKTEITTNSDNHQKRPPHMKENQRSFVTPNTRVLYLSKSIATSIILDLSPSVVSVSPQNDCVFLDSIFESLKRTLHLLVKEHQFPTSQPDRNFTLVPKVFVSVIAYTPFIVAKNNQVLTQNRRISSLNIDQVLAELSIVLSKLIQELYELVTSTCGIDFEYETSKSAPSAFVFSSPLNSSIIRHPGSVLDDIYELGLFSSSLMPRLSRLSIVVITDGLFASSNNLNSLRLKNIAVSFISLAAESIYPDACFGYTTYNDLMKFVAKSTQGVYISHSDLIESSRPLLNTKKIPLTSNPLYRLFSWSLHSDTGIDEMQCVTPKMNDSASLISLTSPALIDPMTGVKPEYIARLFCIDQPVEAIQPSHTGLVEQSADMDLVSNHNYHDWRSFKQMSRNLDADFEQVLSCLLREGYLIKSIQLKQRETSNIVARLVLYWKHNLNLEQELQAPYWNSADPFELGDSNNLILKPFLAPTYGDTYCEVIVHGSYNFLHDFYCDKKMKRKSDYRAIAYQQFEHLILGVKQTYDKLQYLSRYYRESNLSKIPSFLQHGNSLLFEQPHTHNLTSAVENMVEKTHQAREFSEYWQEISKLELRSWKNIMHVHTLRLILEHDQPKFKNLHCQNANGRYTHIQCRRAMSAISNFIRGYASFALLEDSLYIRFIHNKEDDLCDIETSATKGFVVIRIKKLLPIVVIYLMFTSGILDSHRGQIVDHIEDQLMKCKLRNPRTSTTQPPNGPASSFSTSNILKSKFIYSLNESCCMLIRSPLERMLRVYSRSMIGEFLAQNLTHGLPGSCPLNTLSRSMESARSTQTSRNKPGHQNDDSIGQSHKTRTASTANRDDHLDDCDNNLSANSRYNPVFGKYLFGVRVVHTISNLPHGLVHQMVQNVLARISAILMNVRIKQGFHIAFNNSGLLTLVAELELKDYSHDYHSSNCLCQYLVFPPAITNCCPHISNNPVGGGGGGGINAATKMSSGIENVGTPSKPDAFSGSFNNSDSGFLRQRQEHLLPASPSVQGSDNQGEIKVIREYWIEQQYGISCKSNNYHKSLENMRYAEVVDHLYLTDITIFNNLLTYDLLQLLCDKMSPFYDLDIALAQAESRNAPLFSPTSSITSSDINEHGSPLVTGLPSSLIEGTSKDSLSRIPLIELDYQFSLVKFLDYCQFASLDIVLFRDKSEFCEPVLDGDTDLMSDMATNESRKTQANDTNHHHHQQRTPVSGNMIGVQKKDPRRLSVDVNSAEMIHTRREHRSSYDSLNSPLQAYLQPIIGYSLNHLFLETLHKRLKQIHDKELSLSECDRRHMTDYLAKRKTKLEFGVDSCISIDPSNQSPLGDAPLSNNTKSHVGNQAGSRYQDEQDLGGGGVVWRCFMRKANQENLMIVLIPDSLDDINEWMNSNGRDEPALSNRDTNHGRSQYQICPIFVFRCSSTMINNQVLSFLSEEDNSKHDEPLDVEVSPQAARSNLGADLSLHFGQPCKYFGTMRVLNDELYNEILPLNKFSELSQGPLSDEITQELVHFRAFLRKIKNTVLKSRFSSLNDAYLSELFVHKEDISYYINNVDSDIQKKYHVSAHLRGLAEFIKSYEEYQYSLPKEPTKRCNQLLNSILLQKCGLFINQPLARFDEANPLMKQLHDRKLLSMMRCNYKIELPILEENLSNSTYLKEFLKEEPTYDRVRRYHQHQKILSHRQQHQHQPVVTMSASNSMTHSNPETAPAMNGNHASSLGRSSNQGSRLMEMKCGSIGSASMIPPGSSPVDSAKSSIGGNAGSSSQQATHEQLRNQTEIGGSSSLSNIYSILSPSSDSFFLEAFKNSTYSIDEVVSDCQTITDISLRHEAHMAEVLRRKGERKESHHYRRVLKSKANHNQSHSAIDQALKRVDSLGRLEHFCLTPLLFSPAWRTKLAPVRDHTVEIGGFKHANDGDLQAGFAADENEYHQPQMESVYASEQEDPNERWHQAICNNYIKEYEQYIQTLGFNSVQIRFPSSSKLQTSLSSSSGFASMSQQSTSKSANRKTSLQATMKYSSNRTHTQARRDSTTNSPGTSFVPMPTSSPMTSTNKPSVVKTLTGSNSNTGYLIKFLNSGCLVFKVGFCKPYVYSILYSIEGERFNNSNTKVNMTAFLDELDSIKVTLHLHSFTYDYHLRSMYSYISRRQINFNPGYHLISFADDFRKYYQKAPNYARNHILSGDIEISNLKVDGQQLYNYIVTHNSIYQLEVLEMSSATATNLMNSFAKASNSSNDMVDEGKTRTATQQFASFLSSQFRSGSEAFSAGEKQSDGTSNLWPRNHANDYVLIELKREKVRYKDGKDPDIFDCGLLIAHDSEQTSASKNCLVLRYFLILTNQRDLYPRLLHTGDTLIGLGCHRPIRLGVTATKPTITTATKTTTISSQAVAIINETTDSAETTLVEQNLIPYSSSSATTTVFNSTDLDDVQSASEFLSSSEISGPQSILSTVNSVASYNSVGPEKQPPPSEQMPISDTESSLTSSVQRLSQYDTSSVSQILTEKASEALVVDELQMVSRKPSQTRSDASLEQSRQSSEVNLGGNNNGLDEVSSIDLASAENTESRGTRLEPADTQQLKQQQQQQQQQQPQPEVQQREQAICDEEITYLGYFSSDEMDMLKFLQDKTASLRAHLKQIVHQAEIHFRRDYLWHKLMQRQAPTDHQSSSIMGGRSSSSAEQLPLAMDELFQLLAIVEAIDLSQLDSDLTTFSTMHISWYLKLLKTFGELKQSPAGCQHRIYSVKASKILLLYIDPKCTNAFILLSVNAERGSVELSMLLKDKQDCCSSQPVGGGQIGDQTSGSPVNEHTPTMIDLDADCQQLVCDFINFCATFMWSNLLT